MKKDLADIMKEKMQKEGFWVICEPSEAAIAVLEFLGENTAEERAKHETPQKYVQRGDKIVVINLTENIWGGIEIYRKRDVFIRYDKEKNKLVVKRNIELAKRMLPIEDFLIPDGEETIVARDGTVITQTKYHVSDKWFKELAATGYITEEEARHYWQKENTTKLPHIIEED